MKVDAIATERTILRKITPQDLDAFTNLLSNPEVMHFSLNGPYSKAQTQKFIEGCINNYEKNGFGLYAVVLKAQRLVIGYCGYYLQVIDGVEEVEIGYRLLPNYWRQGIATEVAQAVQNYGFNHLAIKRFISIIESENIASIKVAEKCGLRLEKESLFQNRIPVLIYSIAKP